MITEQHQQSAVKKLTKQKKKAIKDYKKTLNNTESILDTTIKTATQSENILCNNILTDSQKIVTSKGKLEIFQAETICLDETDEIEPTVKKDLINYQNDSNLSVISNENIEISEIIAFETNVIADVPQKEPNLKYVNKFEIMALKVPTIEETLTNICEKAVEQDEKEACKSKSKFTNLEHNVVSKQMILENVKLQPNLKIPKEESVKTISEKMESIEVYENVPQSQTSDIKTFLGDVPGKVKVMFSDGHKSVVTEEVFPNDTIAGKKYNEISHSKAGTSFSKQNIKDVSLQTVLEQTGEIESQRKPNNEIATVTVDTLIPIEISSNELNDSETKLECIQQKTDNKTAKRQSTHTLAVVLQDQPTSYDTTTVLNKDIPNYFTPNSSAISNTSAETTEIVCLENVEHLKTFSKSKSKISFDTPSLKINELKGKTVTFQTVLEQVNEQQLLTEKSKSELLKPALAHFLQAPLSNQTNTSQATSNFKQIVSESFQPKISYDSKPTILKSEILAFENLQTVEKESQPVEKRTDVQLNIYEPHLLITILETEEKESKLTIPAPIIEEKIQPKLTDTQNALLTEQTYSEEHTWPQENVKSTATLANVRLFEFNNQKQITEQIVFESAGNEKDNPLIKEKITDFVIENEKFIEIFEPQFNEKEICLTIPKIPTKSENIQVEKGHFMKTAITQQTQLSESTTEIIEKPNIKRKSHVLFECPYVLTISEVSVNDNIDLFEKESLPQNESTITVLNFIESQVSTFLTKSYEKEHNFLVSNLLKNEIAIEKLTESPKYVTVIENLPILQEIPFQFQAEQTKRQPVIIFHNYQILREEPSTFDKEEKLTLPESQNERKVHTLFGLLEAVLVSSEYVQEMENISQNTHIVEKFRAKCDKTHLLSSALICENQPNLSLGHLEPQKMNLSLTQSNFDIVNELKVIEVTAFDALVDIILPNICNKEEKLPTAITMENQLPVSTEYQVQENTGNLKISSKTDTELKSVNLYKKPFGKLPVIEQQTYVISGKSLKDAQPYIESANTILIEYNTQRVEEEVNIFENTDSFDCAFKSHLSQAKVMPIFYQHYFTKTHECEEKEGLITKFVDVNPQNTTKSIDEQMPAIVDDVFSFETLNHFKTSEIHGERIRPSFVHTSQAVLAKETGIYGSTQPVTNYYEESKQRATENLHSLNTVKNLIQQELFKENYIPETSVVPQHAHKVQLTLDSVLVEDNFVMNNSEPYNRLQHIGNLQKSTQKSTLEEETLEPPETLIIQEEKVFKTHPEKIHYNKQSKTLSKTNTHDSRMELDEEILSNKTNQMESKTEREETLEQFTVTGKYK